MSSSESSPSIPFKSKKLLSNPSSKPQSTSSDALLKSKTPEKPPAPLPGRTRNRSSALSLKEVRSAAATSLTPSLRPTDQIKSARKQILSWPSESQPPKPKNAGEGSMKLPQKYEMLGEFFDGLDSAIRLLKLKGSMSTFTNISRKIECLTDRRFSHSHLAQLKYILPEPLEIKRVLTLDERTHCMKPDLHVTLNFDAIEYDENLKTDSKNMSLRKVFRARLVDFSKAHPEGDEIPEEMLPDPFNLSKRNLHSNMSPVSSSSDNVSTGDLTNRPQSSLTSNIERDAICEEIQPEQSSLSAAVETSTDAVLKQQPVAASHLSQTFQRHFSKKVLNVEADKISQVSKVSVQASVVPVREACLTSSNEESRSYSALSELSSKTISCKTYLSNCTSPAKFLSSCSPVTPIKEIESIEHKDMSPMQSTPAKLASTPARLMAATPALQPPKRCYMSPDDVSSSSPNKLVRRPPRGRSLKFDTPVENEKIENEMEKKVEDEPNKMDDASIDDDILGILPDSLLQSIREKEKKAMEERDPAISQAKRRRQMIACLPKLFNVIHFLFQSIRRSVITKEELVHKIIAGHADIVDRREVDEQLNLMLELVPEWISEKKSFAGDILICINKLSSAESVRGRLEEAK